MIGKPDSVYARTARGGTALFLGLAVFAGCMGEIGETPDGLPPPGPGAAGTTGTTGTAGSQGNPNPTATDLPCDVSTVLSNRCWSCHGSTPMLGLPALTSVAAFTAASREMPSQTIAAVAVARMQSTTMPMPPPPNSVATTAEIAVISSWVAAGTPAGSGCGTPTSPVCTSMMTWRGGNDGSSQMNPGMACNDCHQRSGGEAPRFSIAGTVYPTAHEPDLCYGAGASSGAQVVITGADGRTLTLTPNAAGNFYSQTAVAVPFTAKVVSAAGVRAMTATQTSGDCNSCHTQDGANAAPGRIMLP